MPRKEAQAKRKLKFIGPLVQYSFRDAPRNSWLREQGESGEKDKDELTPRILKDIS